ncbi:MAG TPA: 8-amino-7-oxononanoate synthase, partial [Candidatus Obscuribacterales bacterium]
PPMPPSPSPYDWIDHALTTLHRAHRHRTVQCLEGKAGPVMQLKGRSVINFASNDYLGLAGDDRLAAAAIAAIETYGTGSTGSRLLSGQRDLHRQLEQAIAAWKGTEDAIVFSSGYLANMGTISALVGQRDLILSDQYNHSSLLSGARLSGATLQTYPHNDLVNLRQQLQATRSHHRRALIVTDSVFSMDGDCCPLPDLLRLAAEFDCMVLVDEAHGTGVFGPSGSGVVEAMGCPRQPIVQMGTLSKALGSLGGYVTGTAPLIDFLRNRAPSWIYTTGLSPADAAAALAAIAIVQQEPERRAALWHNVHTLKQAIAALVCQSPPGVFKALLPSDSPILCLEVADAATVIRLGRQLQEAGCLVAAVRPPTVPVSRLRLTVMATHQPAHLQQLIQGLATLHCQPLSAS